MRGRYERPETLNHGEEDGAQLACVALHVPPPPLPSLLTA